MAAQDTQRKLTAILCADVVGYSRLMGDDEEATVETLTAFRKVFLLGIENHRGRVVDAKGDAILAEFVSVVDAVNSAVDIQRELAGKNADLSGERRMDFRIGINLGDVLVKDDVIYGDGVNIAARLEALAEPGGICISRPVYDQVEAKLKFEYEYLGEQQVKNIAKPVRAYRVLLEPITHSQADGNGELAIPAQSSSLDRPGKPSIAALPFNNLSADTNQEFFADGLVEEILTSLSKVSSMTVIARNSTFAYKGKAVDVRQVARELGVRYILEGSVRQGGNRLRITAQLIDSTDGSHLWAERYDRVVEDIFDIQDEITKEIVTALRVRLTDGEPALLFSRGTNNVQAWGKCVESHQYFYLYNPADNAKALELIEKAVELDPTYGLAWALMGLIYWYVSRTAFAVDSHRALARALELEGQARALDETNPWISRLSIFLRISAREFDESIAAAERALALHPGSARMRHTYGVALFANSQPEKAVLMIEDAMRLNPHYEPSYTSWLSRAMDAAGNPGKAMEVIEAGLVRNPTQFGLFFNRAAILARDGSASEAKEAVADLRRNNPNFRVSHVDQFLTLRDQEYADTIAESLRKAGLPE
ncbi:MAG: adenylate/guanylate cyclase domain-containing protein [SAR324 cluster bacterium]|nr:adenylate/guanylate cyclase domain-containing protein [SAR324 cluster bacterium]